MVAENAEVHADTPAISHVDGLGRTFARLQLGLLSGRGH